MCKHVWKWKCLCLHPGEGGGEQNHTPPCWICGLREGQEQAFVMFTVGFLELVPTALHDLLWWIQHLKDVILKQITKELICGFPFLNI